MSTKVKVLADSIAPSGVRLTTMEWRYPRPIHSEIMTHGALSRNAASSRAIPTEKLIQRILDDPWVPDYIGTNQRGMTAGAELHEKDRAEAVAEWLKARDNAVESARQMLGLGVHKQVVNRLLETWMHITIIVSATDWNNFDALRIHKDAEPHFCELATMAKAARDASTPAPVGLNGWHLPLFDMGYCSEDLLALNKLAAELGDTSAAAIQALVVKVAVGRCARISYLTHDGKRDLREDVALHDRLLVQRPLHASPAEHVAKALATPERHAKLRGWISYRMTLPFEHVPG